ncbi:MAG TPA: cytochrome c, partial [Phenylobacterium sp.]
FALPDRPRLPGRLLVFKLGGKATVADYQIPQKVNLDLTGVTTTGDVQRGFALFHNNCQVCHGPNASGAFLPDLKRSQMLLSPDSFSQVVVGGALAPRGMPSFKQYLTAAEAEDLRAYIIAEAKGQPMPAVPAAKGGAPAT